MVDIKVKAILEAPGGLKIIDLDKVRQMKSEGQMLAVYRAFVEDDWEKFKEKQTKIVSDAKKSHGSVSGEKLKERLKHEFFFKDRCVCICLCLCVCVCMHAWICVREEAQGETET